MEGRSSGTRTAGQALSRGGTPDPGAPAAAARATAQSWPRSGRLPRPTPLRTRRRRLQPAGHRPDRPRKQVAALTLPPPAAWRAPAAALLRGSPKGPPPRANAACPMLGLHAGSVICPTTGRPCGCGGQAGASEPPACSPPTPSRPSGAAGLRWPQTAYTPLHREWHVCGPCARLSPSDACPCSGASVSCGAQAAHDSGALPARAGGHLAPSSHPRQTPPPQAGAPGCQARGRQHRRAPWNLRPVRRSHGCTVALASCSCRHHQKGGSLVVDLRRSFRNRAARQSCLVASNPVHLPALPCPCRGGHRDEVQARPIRQPDRHHARPGAKRGRGVTRAAAVTLPCMHACHWHTSSPRAAAPVPQFLL